MNTSRIGGMLRAIASSWLLLAAQVGMQFVQIPIALHYLGKDGLGVFAIVTQLIAMSMLAELGASFAFGRLLIDARVEGEDRYRRVWASGFAILLIQAVTIFVAMASVSPWLPRWFNIPEEFSSTVTWVFLACGLVATVRYSLKIFDLALFAAQRLATSNLILTVANIGQFCAFVGSMMLGFGLWACVHGLIASLIISLSGQIWACRRESLALPLSIKHASLVEMKSMFVLGLDVFILVLFNIALSNTLVLFAGMIRPFSDVTRLAVNLKMQQFVTIFVQRFVSATEPPLMDLVSRNQLDRFRFAWGITTQLLLSVTALGGGFVYIWCEPAVNWWTGDHFQLTRSGYMWLGLFSLRMMTHQFLVSSLVMFKQIRLVHKWLICELCVYVLLALLLGSRFGVSGLIAAHVLSLTTGSLLPGQRHLARLAGFSNREMASITLRGLLLPLLAYIALVVSLDPTGGTPYLARFVASAAWGLGLPVMIWVVILSAPERSFLSDLIFSRLRKRSAAA